MNFGQLLVHLGHILGILGGDDPTVTGLTTITGQTTRLTTPIVIDTTTLKELSSKYESTISPKFLSTLVSKDNKDHTVTGLTAETEIVVSKSSVKPTTKQPTTDTTVSETDTTGSETTVTGMSSSTITGHTGTDTTVTGHTGTDTTVTGHTGTDTTVTGHTGTDTTVTGSETTASPTGTKTTVTGLTGSGSSTASRSVSSTTEVPPTKNPGLSRGAVAGIVIGCLLLVAVVTSAVVFFVKNRSSPEAQRLRV